MQALASRSFRCDKRKAYIGGWIYPEYVLFGEGLLSVSISIGYNSYTFIFDRAKGLAAPAKLLVVVRGVEIEHCRELTRDITAMMELLFILNVEIVQKVFVPLAGCQGEGRRCWTRRRSSTRSSCCTVLRANRSAAVVCSRRIKDQ